jgi:hypothetical protein
MPVVASVSSAISSVTRRRMRVGIMGLGYVGLALAVCFAEEGHDVVGVDIDARKIEALAGGVSTSRTSGRTVSRRPWRNAPKSRSAQPTSLAAMPCWSAYRSRGRPTVSRTRAAGQCDSFLGRSAAAWAADRPGVDDLPRDHAGPDGAEPREVRPGRRPRLPPGLLARARGPRTYDYTLRNTPKLLGASSRHAPIELRPCTARCATRSSGSPVRRPRS